MQIESDQFFADCAGAPFWQTDGDDQQYKRGTFNNMRERQEIQHCVHRIQYQKHNSFKGLWMGFGQ